MDLNLKPTQLRVLGCLIEKQLTTPEYYPLTLSALTNACNQKSNREPVMSLTESTVLDTIKTLEDLYLVREKQLPGSRAAKYAHKLTGTLTDQFGFNEYEVAVLSVLFLRGPQTAGEIRTRTQRSCDFAHVQEVDQVLSRLADKNGKQYVTALTRQAGKREIRYAHLFGDEAFENEAQAMPEPLQPQIQAAIQTTTSQTQNEVAELRETVAQLRRELDIVKAQVAQFID